MSVAYVAQLELEEATRAIDRLNAQLSTKSQEVWE